VQRREGGCAVGARLEDGRAARQQPGRRHPGLVLGRPFARRESERERERERESEARLAMFSDAADAGI